MPAPRKTKAAQLDTPPPHALPKVRLTVTRKAAATEDPFGLYPVAAYDWQAASMAEAVAKGLEVADLYAQTCHPDAPFDSVQVDWYGTVGKPASVVIYASAHPFPQSSLDARHIDPRPIP